MTNIEVATKNVAPWIGVGESGNWSDVDKAMEACGLNFTVTKQDALYNYDQDGITFYDKVPEVQVNVRQEDNKALGCVSSTYTLVQNSEVFSMLTPFLEAGAIITNGGMTNEGLCFMVADTGEMNWGGDNYRVNIMATNSFNGRFPAAIICSPLRIIWQNMYRSLMCNKDNVARFRHSLNVDNRLQAVREATGMFINFKDEFGSKVETLKQLPAAHSIEEFVELLFPYSNDKDVDELSQRAINARERVDDRRHHYINAYYNSDTNSDFGSCFALVNAYYDYTSHSVPITKEEEDYKGRRLSNLVGGQAINMKMIQYMCEAK